jgi:hypothetical protein
MQNTIPGRLILPSLVLSLSILKLNVSMAAQPEAEKNPLFHESPLPYQFLSFDRIHDEHFVLAIEAGMAEQLTQVAAICDEKEKPTFDNTIVAMERYGGCFDVRSERSPISMQQTLTQRCKELKPSCRPSDPRTRTQFIAITDCLAE